jgi:hypothetical protein
MSLAGAVETAGRALELIAARAHNRLTDKERRVVLDAAITCQEALRDNDSGHSNAQANYGIRPALPLAPAA